MPLRAAAGQPALAGQVAGELWRQGSRGTLAAG